MNLQMNDGNEASSNFEMAKVDGHWKPVLTMGWQFPKGSSTFLTSPVFGPALDLAP
jgi:hypothetical protein